MIARYPLQQTLINTIHNPFRGQLRTDLQKWGVDTIGKKKAQLEKELKELQKGICNVPIILQNTAQASLDSLNFSNYDIFSTEPFYDLKGH